MTELKHVKGLAELRQVMRALPDDLAGKALQGAVASGAAAVRNEVTTRAPIRTGKLQRAVYMVRDKALTTLTRAVYHVGVRSGKKWRSRTITAGKRAGQTTSDRDAFYWRFLEFGTSKMAKRPFLRPAFEAKKEEAVDAIKERLATRIKRYTSRLRRTPAGGKS